MVVAPKSTLGNWMNEIRRFCPVLRAVKFLGNPEERVSHELSAISEFHVNVYPRILKCLLTDAETYSRRPASCWEI